MSSDTHGHTPRFVWTRAGLTLHITDDERYERTRCGRRIDRDATSDEVAIRHYWGPCKRCTNEQNTPAAGEGGGI